MHLFKESWQPIISYFLPILKAERRDYAHILKL